MLIGACVYDSVRGEGGAILVVVGAVGAWLSYRGTPIGGGRITEWTAAALLTLVVGFALWVPVCVEQSMLF